MDERGNLMDANTDKTKFIIRMETVVPRVGECSD